MCFAICSIQFQMLFIEMVKKYVVFNVKKGKLPIFFCIFPLTCVPWQIFSMNFGIFCKRILSIMLNRRFSYDCTKTEETSENKFFSLHAGFTDKKGYICSQNVQPCSNRQYMILRRQKYGRYRIFFFLIVKSNFSSLVVNFLFGQPPPRRHLKNNLGSRTLINSSY